ncbi:hypothetical protein KMW28_26790 [Flammeovirga yaeyamensis]|uniref:Uncharacterized protein n=1 Tax=Flammeovirga yaeyamensis TaxID=367791 RepID=A0AAX1NE32_9BACT|nr:contractile injection system tape measure protein [Flammeovirga yaeyamensis]MBB3701403.1 hypothetical protein [Flammeovirga yaeyamensis]NMF38639.1 hypothetical protein [Flammeovirga yaeyamensis]QWG04507.1 hypothetical protein KMW28_26790 [Flammeovirga yaeyamensis]
MNELINLNIDFKSDVNLNEHLIKMELSNFVESQLVPMIDKELEKYGDLDIHIDQLDIDLSSNLVNYKKDTYNTVKQVINDKLNELMHHATSNNHESIDSELNDDSNLIHEHEKEELTDKECLLEFLCNGFVPWYEQERIDSLLSKIIKEKNFTTLLETWQFMLKNKSSNVYSFLSFLINNQLLTTFIKELISSKSELLIAVESLSIQEQKSFLIEVFYQKLSFEESVLNVVLKRSFTVSDLDYILSIAKNSTSLNETLTVELMFYIEKQKRRIKKGLLKDDQKLKEQLNELEDILSSGKSKEDTVEDLHNAAQWKASFIKKQAIQLLLNKTLDPSFEEHLNAHPILLFQFLNIVSEVNKNRVSELLSKYPQLELFGENTFAQQLLLEVIKKRPQFFTDQKFITFLSSSSSSEVEKLEKSILGVIETELNNELKAVLIHELTQLKWMISTKAFTKGTKKWEKKWSAILSYLKSINTISKGEKTLLLMSSVSLETLLTITLQTPSDVLFEVFDQKILGDKIFLNSTNKNSILRCYVDSVENEPNFIDQCIRYYPNHKKEIFALFESVEGFEELVKRKTKISYNKRTLLSIEVFEKYSYGKEKLVEYLVINTSTGKQIKVTVNNEISAELQLVDFLLVQNNVVTSLKSYIESFESIISNCSSNNKRQLEELVEYFIIEDKKSDQRPESISETDIQLCLELIINRNKHLLTVEQKEKLFRYFQYLSIKELSQLNTYSIRQKNKIYSYLSKDYKVKCAKRIDSLELKLNQSYSTIYTTSQIADFIKLIQNELFSSFIHHRMVNGEIIIKYIEQTFSQINFSYSKIYTMTCDALNLKVDDNQLKELKKKQKFIRAKKKNVTMEVSNAGLVILVPYLPLFFKHRGWLTDDNKAFANEESLLRALGIMLYLAQKNVLVEDDRQLLLPKILCGIDIETPIVLDFELTDEEKEGADHLLKTVITHWSALKKMEPDSLRIMFFIRTGSITLKDDWYLEVEPNTYDIFMKLLPWSIKINMLPWMKNKIFCEWGK